MHRHQYHARRRETCAAPSDIPLSVGQLGTDDRDQLATLISGNQPLSPVDAGCPSLQIPSTTNIPQAHASAGQTPARQAARTPVSIRLEGSFGPSGLAPEERMIVYAYLPFTVQWVRKQPLRSGMAFEPPRLTPAAPCSKADMALSAMASNRPRVICRTDKLRHA